MTVQKGREVTVCGHCGEDKKCSRLILGEAVCQRCMLRFRRNPMTCPGCDETKVLAFIDSAGRPSCAACCGQEPVYGCAACGREDRPYGTRCAPCVLGERAAELLAEPGGEIHPRLQVVYDALMAARRPQSVLTWLNRSTGPAVLRAMAQGDTEISHRAFDLLPADKATRHVHELLASLGVVSPFNARLEQMTIWLADTLRSMPSDHADIIARFARWQVLRTRRDQARRDVLTPSSVENGRAAIITAVRFLAWLDEHTLTLAATTQTDLDRYLAEHPGRGEVLVSFITWTARSHLTAGLEMPKWRRGPPEVVLSDHDRWAHVAVLLHDNTIRLAVRVAGLLTLLFAQPLTRICRMRTNQIGHGHLDRVTVNFDTFPIELPAPVDQLILDQLNYHGQSSYPNSPTHWLFPGALPGQHLGTESIRGPLVARGIQPSHARKAAMFQLAAEMPTPILADILGLGTNTAVRWATLAARDWSQYAALRRDHTHPAAAASNLGSTPTP